MNELIIQIIRLSFLGLFSFITALLLTPLFLRLALHFNFGKDIKRERAEIFESLHQKKAGTITMAGIIFEATVILLAIIFYLGDYFKIEFFSFFNFVDRRETFLPLFALIFSGFIGFIDDLLNRLQHQQKGLKIKQKLILYFALAILGSWWFIAKLNFNFINLNGKIFYIKTIVFIFYFIFVFLATSFSANETDGLDGLLAGISLMILIFFLIVSFINGDYNLAAFITTLIGALTAFLWFNIHPAKFFMGDTGSMALGTIIALLSFLTGTSLLLPLIAIVFVIESGSVIIQVISKKIFKRKIFLSTPIHHHFEAKKIAEPTIVFRLWVVNFIGCLLGLVVYLIVKFS